MVNGLSAILPAGCNMEGVVSAPTPPVNRVPGLQYFVSGHPIPNLESWRSAEAILELLRSCTERTVVFFLLSGGGSALVELPLDSSISLEDVQTLNSALVTCGAPIEAINTVRKHLSAVKGGRLAVAAGRARKITLAVTDVPSGKEWALASGPTLADPTTLGDLRRVLAEYDLRGKLPSKLSCWLEGQMSETPKDSHPAFANAHFVLLLGMHDLFHSAHHAAEAHGYVTRCDNSTDDWLVRKAADGLLSQLEEWKRQNSGQKVALVADGEVASPVTGKGIGGRNSAFVLACVEKIAGRKITVLSAGTDGIDGNSSAAGAVADGGTLARAQSKGLNPTAYFEQSDAFTFFNAMEDAIVTGPTNNNLRDLRIFLAEP
jgi:hydroxypyruvate reductase